MNQKASPARNQSHGRGGEGAYAAASAGALGEGWVMGPLGVPVRDTLAVGNRKVQREYVTQMQSPQKPAQNHGAPQPLAIDPFARANGGPFADPYPPQNFAQHPDMRGVDGLIMTLTSTTC